MLVTPEHPYVGGTVRVVAAELGEGPLAVRIDEASSKASTAGDRAVDAEAELRTGLPAATVLRWVPARAGAYRAVVGRQGMGLRCVSFTVVARRAPTAGDPRSLGRTGLWPVRRAWTQGEEALYAAWIRDMFRAPIGQELAFGKLDEVTSNAERNLLHDHLGWGEDSTKPTGLRLKPDCADTPYFFRAYYSWKRGLPFGFRPCDGGRPGVAPACGALTAVTPRPEPERPDATRQPATTAASAASSAAAPARPDPMRWLDGPRPAPTSKDGKRGELAAVQEFFSRTLAWGVHTGNARTAYGDDATDFYPVSLTQHGLRPGTIYADPYGHVLMVVELIPPAGGRPGVLYAADGQPDGSFTRKRFWEGNFLFNPDPALGGSGFKAFRPLVVRERAGESHLIALKDAEIAKEPGYGDVSREQASLSAEAFYDRMERLITPGTRDASAAQEEVVRALSEAARVRVTSIDNGQNISRSIRVRSSRCQRAKGSSRPLALGKISRHPLATCGCSSPSTSSRASTKRSHAARRPMACATRPSSNPYENGSRPNASGSCRTRTWRSRTLGRTGASGLSRSPS